MGFGSLTTINMLCTEYSFHEDVFLVLPLKSCSSDENWMFLCTVFAKII